MDHAQFFGTHGSGLDGLDVHDHHHAMTLLSKVLHRVKSNLSTLQQDWNEMCVDIDQCISQTRQLVGPDELIISKSSLDDILSEAKQIKDSLPKVMSQNTSVIKDALKMYEEYQEMQTERESLVSEVNHWKTQLDSALSEGQKEKKEQLELRIDIQELTNQLTQQSEFCSSLGASCCTLLWRVSRNEESVSNIISGNRSEEFLGLLSNSVQSYLDAYKDCEWPDRELDEANFLLALCGIITNVAASAMGREYLSSNTCGQAVIDVFIIFLTQAPVGKGTAMKNLMLMGLYNLSINQKGLSYICGKPGIIAMLAKQLQDELDIEIKVGSLRLVQSLISDEPSPRLMLELKENLSVDYLLQLTKHQCKDIQELSLQMLMDIRQFSAPEQ